MHTGPSSFELLNVLEDADRYPTLQRAGWKEASPIGAPPRLLAVGMLDHGLLFNADVRLILMMSCTQQAGYKSGYFRVFRAHWMQWIAALSFFVIYLASESVLRIQDRCNFALIRSIT